MAPIDTTPQGGEVMHESDEPRYPERTPGAQGDGDVSERPSADADRDKGDAAQATARINPITGAGEDIAG